MDAKATAKRLLEPGQSLSQRVARSGVWVFATQISSQGLGFISTIILARLLVPQDFGIVGIALLAKAVLDIFSITGFNEALIQKKENIAEYLNTAWVVSIIRGFVLALILFGIAPFVASFFNSPMSSPILRVLAITCVLGGFANIGVIYFQKELEFGKQFVYLLSGTVVNVMVSITAAIILRNAWALVLGMLAGSVIQCIVSYLVHPYRPHFHFQLGQAKELFRFGRWMLASAIVVFLATQGDDAFLGKVLGVTALGLYLMAFRFGNLSGAMVGVISRVAFPAYSKLQDNIPQLRNAYLKTVRVVSFLAIPLSGGIFMLGPEFTQIFLGDKWMPMVPALRILAISAMIKVITSTGSALYNAVGKPRLYFMIVLFKVIALAAAIYPLTMLWGMAGTAIAVLLSCCVAIPIWFDYIKKAVGIRAIDLKGTLLPPLGATLIMCAGIFVLGMSLNQFQLAGFLVSVFTGMIIYFSFIFLIQKISSYEVLKDISFIFNSLK